jgi:hypothetical protein
VRNSNGRLLQGRLRPQSTSVAQPQLALTYRLHRPRPCGEGERTRTKLLP